MKMDCWPPPVHSQILTCNAMTAWCLLSDHLEQFLITDVNKARRSPFNYQVMKCFKHLTWFFHQNRRGFQIRGSLLHACRRSSKHWSKTHRLDYPDPHMQGGVVTPPRVLIFITFWLNNVFLHFEEDSHQQSFCQWGRRSARKMRMCAHEFLKW